MCYVRQGDRKMSDCTVYIDEAGDLGINRGTTWFVLSAVIVKKDEEANIRNIMQQIKSRLNIREIHLRKITDFNKRAFVVRELCDSEFTYMNVLVDTTKFDANKIPTSIIAYNYVCKYLLQRVSWYLREQNQTADIVLSSRGTSRDGELIEYIRDKLLPYNYNSIYSDVFEKISAKTAANWDLLQLADVCATTMFLTYEVNGYGFRIPCFSLAMNEHLYRRNGEVKSYGIKFFTREMVPNIDEIQSKYICRKKERTPGTTTT